MTESRGLGGKKLDETLSLRPDSGKEETSTVLQFETVISLGITVISFFPEVPRPTKQQERCHVPTVIEYLWVTMSWRIVQSHRGVVCQRVLQSDRGVLHRRVIQRIRGVGRRDVQGGCKGVYYRTNGRCRTLSSHSVLV